MAKILRLTGIVVLLAASAAGGSSARADDAAGAGCGPGCRAERIAAEECHAIYRDVTVRVREVLGLEITRLPELVIERAEGMAARSAETAAASDVCGLYLRDAAGRTSIHLLADLCAARTAAVLAHELAHAWQAENCPEAQGRRLREGFAEWVAWKALEGAPGAEEERAVIAGRTDDYGQGYRIFAALERRQGAEGAIRYATSARRE